MNLFRTRLFLVDLLAFGGSLKYAPNTTLIINGWLDSFDLLSISTEKRVANAMRAKLKKHAAIRMNIYGKAFAR